MIDVAKRHAAFDTPRFITCAFEDLAKTFGEQQFDLIFSNFSGLNCVLPENLPQVAKQLQQLLKPGGHLAAVIFGKYCLWETGYYISKARLGDAFRRRSNQEKIAHLKDSTSVPIFYYSEKRFSKLLSPLKKTASRPVGLFIPPSYLEEAMKKHPRFFMWLVQLEEKCRAMPGSLADHVFLLYKKDMQ
jgi:SAM-dependent methyltransferase